MGTLGGWCEGDVCKNVTHGQCCENYAKTEYQCYDQSKFFCCKVGEAGKGSHSKVNETGPLVCSNSEQKCCVWNVTSSTPGHNETFYFLKKCCKYCCSNVPGECDSNCTKCDGLSAATCKEVGCQWCKITKLCIPSTRECPLLDRNLIVLFGSVALLILILIFVVIGFIVNSKSKKNKKNKSKQALRKKVANEKLSSYPSLLGIDDNNSLKSSEQTWTEDGKLISHRSIAYLPPDFDNSYKDSDVAQRQYNENLYKKARFQRLGNFVSSSVMYDDSGSTDSDVCNDIISTPHSMTEYDSYRSGSESGSYAGHHRGNISSSSSDNSSSKAGPTMPYFSRLLNIRQKQDQQVERRASISSVVPPRFNENTSWKPRRKGAPSRSPVGYVPEVKPMKSTFPQSLEGLSDGNRTCADDDDDDDDDDGDYDEGTSSSEVSGSKTDSSSSSSSPPESGLVSPQPPAATVSPFVPESRGSGGRRGRVLIDTSQSPSPPLMSNKTGIIIN